MEIETIQNIVLIGFGVVAFMMWVTAKSWDEITDEMGQEEKR